MISIFLIAIMAIIGVFTFSNIPHYDFGMTWEEQKQLVTLDDMLIYVIVNAFFITALLATAIFVVGGLGCFLTSSDINSEEKEEILRTFVTAGVEVVGVLLIYYILSVWWHDAICGLICISIVAASCFLPVPRFLYPAQPPLPKEGV